MLPCVGTSTEVADDHGREHHNPSALMVETADCSDDHETYILAVKLDSLPS